MKVLAKRLFRRFGYELITRATALETLQAGNLTQVFERFGIRQALDVGANRGQYYGFLRDQVDFRGNVVSFEPIPNLADALKAKASNDPLWEVRSCALGARVEKRSFNVAGSTQISSFLTLAENVSHVPVNVVEDVQIETIDHLGDQLFKTVPPENTFMKLDTQGFDLEVLKGASRYLDRIRVFTGEVPFIKIYEEMPSFEEYFAFVHDRGFDIAGMWPTFRDSHFRACEFDCLFVRKGS